MDIKKKFLLKNKVTQYSLLPFVQPLLTSLNAGNWLTRILGIFPDGAPTRHSFPDLLDFSRWRSSQISHPGDRHDVKIPTHVRLPMSNSPGLPDPPILGQTSDRCINQYLWYLHENIINDQTESANNSLNAINYHFYGVKGKFSAGIFLRSENMYMFF